MLNPSEQMQKKERHLEVNVLMRYFDFSEVSELTIRNHPAQCLLVNKLRAPEFSKRVQSVVGMYSKGDFLLGHHLYLYRLVSVSLSGTSGAVCSYHWHDSLSSKSVLGLNSQNRGTGILSVFEMGVLPTCHPPVFAPRHSEIFPPRQCAAQAGSCKGFLHFPQKNNLSKKPSPKTQEYQRPTC